MQKAILFEGEKSCLKYASYFGMDRDISCAVCGSSFISYQAELLISLGVKEVIVAFDKQFKELNDDEFKKWVAKLKEINKKYSSDFQVSFMFDKWGLLGYKDSPIDKDKETFLELFKKRIILC
jgi:predicted rRNA methylase YqxC with S4 and FtsJ domains